MWNKWTNYPSICEIGILHPRIFCTSKRERQLKVRKWYFIFMYHQKMLIYFAVLSHMSTFSSFLLLFDRISQSRAKRLFQAVNGRGTTGPSTVHFDRKNFAATPLSGLAISSKSASGAILKIEQQKISMAPNLGAEKRSAPFIFRACRHECSRYTPKRNRR